MGLGLRNLTLFHLVRHNPGIDPGGGAGTAEDRQGSCGETGCQLENKGYLYRKPNPEDGRSQLLYATEKAEQLKNSKAAIESAFYEWLLAELPEEEKEAFCKTLDTLYWRSKQERRAGFVNVAKCVVEGAGEDETDI